MPDPTTPPEITEIRIHGVGGTPPSALLEDPDPRQVWGDRVAGFYRKQNATGPRHVEAYSWGGLTSRSWTRVFWLLLFPFMTANMAGWMAPPRPDRGWRRLRHGLARSYFLLARLAALAATLNVILINSLGALDPVAYQWGGGSAQAIDLWFNPFGWSVLNDHPARRLVVGALWPVLLIGVFAYLSLRTRRDYEQVEPPLRSGETVGPPERTAAAMPDGLRDPQFWSGYQAHTRLSRYHLAVALALVAVLLARCAVAATSAGGGDVRAGWAAELVTALGVVVLLASAVLLGRDRLKDQQLSRWVFWSGPALLGLAVAVALAQPPATTLATELPGMRDAFNTSWIVFLILLLPLFVHLGVTAWLRRGEPGGSTSHFAFAPFVVNGFGLIVANIVMLGLLLVVASRLSTGDLRWEIPLVPAPATDTTIYVFPMVATAISLLTVGLLVVLAGVLIWQFTLLQRAGRGAGRQEVAKALAQEYEGEKLAEPRSVRSVNAWAERAAPPHPYSASTESPVARQWVRHIARWRFLATRAPVVSVLVNVVVVLALVLTLGFGLIYLITGSTPEMPDALVGIGVFLGVLIPPAVLALARWSWRSSDNRRIVGVLWDVGTFFPRSYHPFAPPSYTERAVPELLRRIWYLHDTGSRVLLAAHSQGSVIAAAAVSRTPPRVPDEPEIVLATFGSPLRKLYQWGFPTYFPDDLLAGLTGRSGIGPVRWHNFYYLTDYIGGQAGGDGIDESLSDPPTCLYTYGQPVPKVGSHTGYWNDPTFRRKIDQLCRDIEPPAGAADPGRTGNTRPSPGTDGPVAAAAGTGSAGSSPGPGR